MKRLMMAALTALVMMHGTPAALYGQTKPATSDERHQTADTSSTRAKPLDSEKIRQKVETLGIGSRVTVVLRNGNEYYGAIAGASAESFELSEIDLKQKLAIAYSDVKKVRSGFGNPNQFNGKRWHPGWHIAATLTVVGLTVALIVAGAAASR